MAINLFENAHIVDPNQLNELANRVNAIEQNLINKSLQEEITLWIGDSYLDGGTNYALWSTSMHRPWDYVRLYVAYDTQSINGTNGRVFEINCGPSYSYNQDHPNYSTLCRTHAGHYRRICVRTNGLSVYNGEGGGWYLQKVVGVVKHQYQIGN